MIITKNSSNNNNNYDIISFILTGHRVLPNPLPARCRTLGLVHNSSTTRPYKSVYMYSWRWGTCQTLRITRAAIKRLNKEPILIRPNRRLDDCNLVTPTLVDSHLLGLLTVTAW